jgi:hypothetical protein
MLCDETETALITKRARACVTRRVHVGWELRTELAALAEGVRSNRFDCDDTRRIALNDSIRKNQHDF